MLLKQIHIDHRERADILCQALRSKYNFEVTITTLKVGDYLIEPDVHIERKTTYDFLVSLMDGRLFDQAFKLAEYRKRPIMIIEGKSFFTDGHPMVSHEAVKGALISLAQTYYIPILRTTDELDTAWHLNQLYEHRQRVGQHPGILLSYKPKKIETQKLLLLRSLPGIGPKTAKSLLNHFVTIKNFANAPKKELLNLENTVDFEGAVTRQQAEAVVTTTK